MIWHTVCSLPPQSLSDPNNYHEFCRLLARLKSNYQLGELVKVENYPEVIRLIANFTVTSLQVGLIAFGLLFCWCLSKWRSFPPCIYLAVAVPIVRPSGRFCNRRVQQCCIDHTLNSGWKVHEGSFVVTAMESFLVPSIATADWGLF